MSLLLRRAVAPPWHTRVARANVGGGASANFLRGPWCSASTSVLAPISVAAGSANLARFKSTLAPAGPSTDGTSEFAEWDGLSNGRTPALVRLRKFPIVGSMIPFLSGIPKINPMNNSYEFWLAMRNKFGEFYELGYMIAGRPDDIYRTCFMINDPREIVRIVRAGGKFPSGVLNIFWVNRRWCETRGMEHSAALHGRGEAWRKTRSFLQTDLLHPDAANGYLPGILRAVELASNGAQAAATLQSSGEEKGALNSYLNRCAFDMFSSLSFGVFTETADVTTPTDPENQRFVDGAVQGLSTAMQILFSPWENVVAKLLKIETEKMKHCFNGFDAAWAIAQDMVKRFVERKERGELTENERMSYLSRALDRRNEDGNDMSIRDVAEVSFVGMFAAVDTTSSVLGWNLFHVARTPRVQECLHEELSSAVESIGNGELTPEILGRSHSPYLHAVIRETLRLTPPAPIAMTKTVDVEGLEVHGRPMAKGDVVSLEYYSTTMNPELVDCPYEFRPERWLSEAVEARKGTNKEVIDHPFLAAPFSQGARRCPGSRVASLEIRAMLARLVLDWKFSSPVSSMKDITYRRKSVLELDMPDLQFEAR